MMLTTVSVFAAVVTMVACQIQVPVPPEKLPTEKEPRYPQKLYLEDKKRDKFYCNKYSCKPKSIGVMNCTVQFLENNQIKSYSELLTPDLGGFYKSTLNNKEELRVVVFDEYGGDIQHHHFYSKDKLVKGSYSTKEPNPPQAILDKLDKLTQHRKEYKPVDNSNCKYKN